MSKNPAAAEYRASSDLTRSWQIGAVRVTSIFEQHLLDIEQLIPDATPAVLESAAWLAPSFVGADGKMLGAIQAFVIEASGRRIVVDCCVGDGKDRPVFGGLGWHRSHHGFLERLATAGIAREDVDVVLCTHLHMDHVGWNTMQVAGRWVPTFPRARHLIARREFEHLERELAASPKLDALGIEADQLLAALADPGRLHDLMSAHALSFEQLVHCALDLTTRQTWADSILPIVEAGLVELVDDDHAVCAEVALTPTHGHTPGHVSVRIRSGAHEALISGDAIHHPVQLARPELTTVVDANPAQGVATRRTLLSALANNDSLLIGTHFAPPTAGRLRQEGAGYRLCRADPEAGEKNGAT
ncbi:MBL fold metallo-hydrolase [Burkholderia sp. D-99]|uniref:MBL fold metallo-hydrolase n=1 Tax=Burkholderia sp. D-99 TaxID=2717316 RepID=UPI0014239EE0|nr:MBL fold metallo-hydrolase [Burkholderia sp. D-99]NHV25897.1 MBL fold metallo-hydrolase [Burkholderia sp. D-99]